MSEKLDKLRASLEKERERRIKINTRIESLERRIQEAEAAEVNEMVRTAKVTPEQLAALLRQSATSTPTPAALSAVGATFNKEDDSNAVSYTHLDVYKRQIWDYVNGFTSGQISREAFWALAKFKHPTHQISFHTVNALHCLTFERSESIHDRKAEK